MARRAGCEPANTATHAELASGSEASHMADIFLSYSSSDVDRAKPFVSLFERHGWTVWWDQRIPVAKSYAAVIEEEIRNASCVVVLWSARSVASEWVQNEASEGHRRRVLFQVLIENVPIPFEFRRIEAAKLYDWDGATQHPELDLLLSSLAAIVPRPVPDASRGATAITPAERIRAWSRQSRLLVVAILLVAGIAVGIWRAWVRSPVLLLQKVSGDGQIVPRSEGGWARFEVKVSDRDGSPVAGQAVAWQTPYCGNAVYVGRTDERGISGARTTCNTLPPGQHEHRAMLVLRRTPNGYKPLSDVAPTGTPIVFTFEMTNGDAGAPPGQEP